MTIDVPTLLREIDRIEADMRRLESRLTAIRERLHDGRRDVRLDGSPTNQPPIGLSL